MAHKESARVWVMFFFSLIIQMTRRSSLYFTKKKKTRHPKFILFGCLKIKFISYIKLYLDGSTCMTKH
jgi:hypothetical protein